MIRRSLKQLRIVLKPYRWHLAVATVLVFLPSYFAIWSPYLIGRLIDSIVHSAASDLLFLGFLLLAVRSLHFVIAASSAYCLRALGLEILVEARRHLMRRLMSYPFSYFDHHKSGTLTTRLTNDINSLNEFLSSAMLPLFGSIFLILGGATVMIWLEWRLALAALTILPLFVVLTIRADIRIRRKFSLMRRGLSAVNAATAETLSGARDIQMFNGQKFFTQRFNYLSGRLASKSIGAVREYAHYNPLIPFMTGTMDAIILGFGGWLVFRGELTVGALVTFLAYSSYFGWPLREFSEKLGIFQQAIAALDRLADLAEAEPESDGGFRPFVHGAIHFKDVTHCYHSDDPPAVDGLNFEIRQGESVALIGKTGSGKTTTCALLLRFYEPTTGIISINGTAIRDFSLSNLRQRIVWISQDIVIFSETIRENVRLFDESIDDQQILSALERVGLGDWLRIFSKGLDEELMERGSTLSGGQRQLLALARAIVRKPSILILDEATSQIDYKTEAMVQKTLDIVRRDLKDCTFILVAHRLSTVKACDRLLVFERGRVVDEGSYDEIVQRQSSGADLLRESGVGSVG